MILQTNNSRRVIGCATSLLNRNYIYPIISSQCMGKSSKYYYILPIDTDVITEVQNIMFE